MKLFLSLFISLIGFSVFGDAIPSVSIEVANDLQAENSPHGTNVIQALGGDLAGAATNAFNSATNFAATQNTNFVTSTTNVIGVTGNAGGTYLSSSSTTWTNFNNSLFSILLTGGNLFIQSNSVSLYSIAVASVPGAASLISGSAPAPFVNYGRYQNDNGQIHTGWFNSTNLTGQTLALINQYIGEPTNGISTNYSGFVYLTNSANVFGGNGSLISGVSKIYYVTNIIAQGFGMAAWIQGATNGNINGAWYFAHTNSSLTQGIYTNAVNMTNFLTYDPLNGQWEIDSSTNDPTQDTQIYIGSIGFPFGGPATAQSYQTPGTVFFYANSNNKPFPLEFSYGALKTNVVAWVQPTYPTNYLFVDSINGNDLSASRGGYPYRGLDTAAASAISGDVIYLPAAPETNAQYTSVVIPSGVSVIGQGPLSVVNPTVISVQSNTILQNINFTNTVVQGIIGGTAYGCTFNNLLFNNFQSIDCFLNGFINCTWSSVRAYCGDDTINASYGGTFYNCLFYTDPTVSYPFSAGGYCRNINGSSNRVYYTTCILTNMIGSPHINVQEDYAGIPTLLVSCSIFHSSTNSSLVTSATGGAGVVTGNWTDNGTNINNSGYYGNAVGLTNILSTSISGTITNTATATNILSAAALVGTAANGTVSSNSINSGGINASQIKGGITASNLSGTITSNQISFITASQIQGAITASNLSGTVTSNQIVSVNAGQVVGLSNGSGFATNYSGVISLTNNANNISGNQLLFTNGNITNIFTTIIKSSNITNSGAIVNNSGSIYVGGSFGLNIDQYGVHAAQPDSFINSAGGVGAGSMEFGGSSNGFFGNGGNTFQYSEIVGGTSNTMRINAGPGGLNDAVIGGQFNWISTVGEVDNSAIIGGSSNQVRAANSIGMGVNGTVGQNANNSFLWSDGSVGISTVLIDHTAEFSCSNFTILSPNATLNGAAILTNGATVTAGTLSGVTITNAFITNSVFAGNGGGLTNLANTNMYFTELSSTNWPPTYLGSVIGTTTNIVSFGTTNCQCIVPVPGWWVAHGWYALNQNTVTTSALGTNYAQFYQSNSTPSFIQSPYIFIIPARVTSTGDFGFQYIETDPFQAAAGDVIQFRDAWPLGYTSGNFLCRAHMKLTWHGSVQ